jgi:hypothetical protein
MDLRHFVSTLSVSKIIEFCQFLALTSGRNTYDKKIEDLEKRLPKIDKNCFFGRHVNMLDT